LWDPGPTSKVVQVIAQSNRNDRRLLVATYRRSSGSRAQSSRTTTRRPCSGWAPFRRNVRLAPPRPCRGCPIAARQTAHQSPVGIGPGKDVMLIRCRRSRPLTVDALATFIEEHFDVPCAAVQFRQAARHRRPVRVHPRSVPNACTGVGWIIAIAWVPLHA
jgi:hypothetical protein